MKHFKQYLAEEKTITLSDRVITIRPYEADVSKIPEKILKRYGAPKFEVVVKFKEVGNKSPEFSSVSAKMPSEELALKWAKEQKWKEAPTYDAVSGGGKFSVE